MRKTILIVDDTAVRNALKDALEAEYRILEAATYHDVIEQLSTSIDLVLIDYFLPDSDGFAMLNAIRKIKPEVPVIIMSGYSNENLALRALRNRVKDYIKKPVELAYLKKRVSEILGG